VSTFASKAPDDGCADAAAATNYQCPFVFKMTAHEAPPCTQVVASVNFYFTAMIDSIQK
jgi:hypothetical protein